MTSIMWKSTDFLRPVIGEVEDQGTIIFLIGAFLWWVTTNHGEQMKNKHSMNGW